MARFAIPIAAVLTTTAACNVAQPSTLSGPSSSNATATGSGGSSSTSTSAATTGAVTSSTGEAATFTVSLDDTMPAVDLDSKLALTVTVKPNGFVGPVSLVANGLSTGGIAAMLGTSNLTLDGTTNATTTLNLETGTSTPPNALPFTVAAFAPAGTASVSATVTVNAAITIHIPKNVNQLGGTQQNPYTTAFGPYPIPITAPTGISTTKTVKVRFFNDDDIQHEIHASQQAQGFDHDPGPIDPHTMDTDVRQVNATGTYDFYLHDQNVPSTIGRIVIQ